MLQDIGTVNKELRQQFPDIPLILFGHSMGSLAVRAFAAEHDDCMDMLIVYADLQVTARPGYLEKPLPMWKEKFWECVTEAVFWSFFLLEHTQ